MDCTLLTITDLGRVINNTALILEDPAHVMLDQFLHSLDHQNPNGSHEELRHEESKCDNFPILGSPIPKLTLPMAHGESDKEGVHQEYHHVDGRPSPPCFETLKIENRLVHKPASASQEDDRHDSLD